LLNYIESFSTLSYSKIEGIEAFASRFGQIYGTIKKKPYDVLDQRKTEFNADFEDFKRQMRDLEVNKFF
jgi:dynein heavy chain